MAHPAAEIVATDAETKSTETLEQDQIAARAYELWQARGCPEGSPDDDWLQAEQELIASR